MMLKQAMHWEANATKWRPRELDWHQKRRFKWNCHMLEGSTRALCQQTRLASICGTVCASPELNQGPTHRTDANAFLVYSELKARVFWLQMSFFTVLTVLPSLSHIWEPLCGGEREGRKEIEGTGENTPWNKLLVTVLRMLQAQQGS